MSCSANEGLKNRNSHRYRQKVGSAYFIGGFLNTHELVGYVSGTLTRSPTLTHDSMSVHEADGTTLAIHSVCVSPHHRRKGLASRLLGKYLEAMATREEVKRVALICHEELIPLYHKAGFELVGKSEVVHGPRGWFEMRHDYQR